MADEAIAGHLDPPQMAMDHLRPSAIGDFYNVPIWAVDLRTRSHNI